MSKAEKRACEYTCYCRNQSYKDYINGCHQAEKDFELTLEDVRRICLIAREVHQFMGFWSDTIYQEVLKRFKERKGE